MGLTVGHRHPPTMICDDRPANRQPHTHPVGFRCKERLEDAVDVLWIDPRSGVLQCDDHAGRIVALRTCPQYPRPIDYQTGGVDGIHHQI